MSITRRLALKSVPRIAKSFHTTAVVPMAKRWKEKTTPAFQTELTNPVSEVYGANERWPDDEVK